MALINTLLSAIVRADGDALVMHAGERPYVVTASGNVELSTNNLTVEAASGMLAQLVPKDLLSTLSHLGVVEHQLQPPSTMRDAFTVVAARGGDDIWIELRRKRAMVSTVTETPKEPEVSKVAEADVAPERPRVAEVASAAGLAAAAPVPAVHALSPVSEVASAAEAADVRDRAETTAPDLQRLQKRPRKQHQKKPRPKKRWSPRHRRPRLWKSKRHRYRTRWLLSNKCQRPCKLTTRPRSKKCQRMWEVTKRGRSKSPI
jgi:hypothetical protein